MQLSKVTLTGADDSITPEELFSLAKSFPFSEWGILLSRNSMGSKRFPSLKWMNELEKLEGFHFDGEINFAGHLCGSWVRELLMGNTSFVDEIGKVWEIFQRVQINTHGIKHDFDEEKLIEALQQFPDKEFIFQYDNANKEILDCVAKAGDIKFSTLFDLSHGDGILPTEWPLPLENISCGYAGGLSPENVLDQLKLIGEKVGEKEIWIDMETKLRSENDMLFNLHKCKSVLTQCQPFFF